MRHVLHRGELLTIAVDPRAESVGTTFWRDLFADTF